MFLKKEVIISSQDTISHIPDENRDIKDQLVSHELQLDPEKGLQETIEDTEASLYTEVNKQAKERLRAAGWVPASESLPSSGEFSAAIPFGSDIIGSRASNRVFIHEGRTVPPDGTCEFWYYYHEGQHGQTALRVETGWSFKPPFSSEIKVGDTWHKYLDTHGTYPDTMMQY